MSDTEEIKNRINLVDLIQDYVQLKKAGVNFKSVCPFHEEKTPSFVVSPAKQIWHCFGCSLGGDHFEFIKQIEGVEFREALQILASRAGVILQKPTAQHIAAQDKKKVLYEINDLAAKFFAKILADHPKAQKARDYLVKRGFKPETIYDWQIGYAPDSFHTFDEFIVKKGYQKKEALEAGLLAERDNDYFDRFRDRIMFPLTDIHGRVVGFTGRLLEEKEGAGKYVNSPETPIYNKSELVFGLNAAKTEIRKNGEAIVVEGNVDVITAHEAGFRNVVGSSGTALTEKQLQALKRFTENLSFAFDTDEAGLAAARRGVEQALKQGFNVRVITIPDELAKDPDELIRADLTIWKKQVETAQPFLDFYFTQTFAKIDLTSSVDKKSAARELLPLVALLPDEIDRSHYLQLLARKLGVEESVFRQKIEKTGTTQRQQANESAAEKKSKKLPKLEMLERRVLGLLLKFADSLSQEWQDFTAEDFETPTLHDLFQRAKSVKLDSDQIDLGDPELSHEASLLVFGVENELTELSDWNLDQIKREFIKDLKQESLKLQMRRLSQQIRLAESEGRSQEAEKLSGEFNSLTKQLSSYSNH